ncbi:DNA segregation ATPase and-like proteins [Bombiscardovia apis]|uniref:DNA segregation ATPase and-like proteins n=1 Tax=Bombiscardovia apis TaxID=2932182 RepID=A0ABN6SGQ4_9BIFI|nr:FtsK/SpoIIIE domain-containing protein [Bombiscardovia apis]BDR54457.1 DNA segregation ATPase and-like proteins [Bombiscardovia apis]
MTRTPQTSTASSGQQTNTSQVQERVRVRLARLTMFAQTSPILAQVGMIVLMGAQGNWLYAALLAPSVLAAAAMSLVQILNQRQETGNGGTRTGTPRTLHSPLPHEAQEDEALLAQLGELPVSDVESLLAASQVVPQGGALWQGIVGEWLKQDSQAHNGGDDPDRYSVKLGSASEGSFELDLPRQGPHALVAGTTGSGKSVLLQDWCLALAGKLPPSAINFIFLDFKGGSAFSQLSRLPHTVGSVSDLNLEAAARAIDGIERELKRREQLVANEGVSSTADLPCPPARLMVVIDEFQALRQQLPDYMDHLVQLASLGRSLGMNLVACTQNPMGQVSTQMKANMNLSISLRVRDSLQSKELLGTSCAAQISPHTPGVGLYSDGDQLKAFRCAYCANPDALVEHICIAAHFSAIEPATALFTPALPKVLSASCRDSLSSLITWKNGNPCLVLGLADDGVRLEPCCLPLHGNIAIIGAAGRGKTTLLQLMCAQLAGLAAQTSLHQALHLTYSDCTGRTAEHRQIRVPPRREPAGIGKARVARQKALAPPLAPRSIWLLDGADDLMDPFNQDPLATRLQEAVADPARTVLVSLESTRYLRQPERFPTQIIFPSGQRADDLMAGIPSPLVQRLDSNVASIAGRAVLIKQGKSQLIQCSQTNFSLKS